MKTMQLKATLMMIFTGAMYSFCISQISSNTSPETSTNEMPITEDIAIADKNIKEDVFVVAEPLTHITVGSPINTKFDKINTYIDANKEKNEKPTETTESTTVVEVVEKTTTEQVTEQITEKATEQTTESGPINLGKFKLTAYCSCKKCCGQWANNRCEEVVGSIGKVLKAGYSIAVDPKVIPYGSIVIINGKEYEAMDCGGAIKKNRIDVYFNSHEEALEFGVQYAIVYLKKKE